MSIGLTGQEMDDAEEETNLKLLHNLNFKVHCTHNIYITFLI